MTLKGKIYQHMFKAFILSITKQNIDSPIFHWS